mmetsp:Transcript_44599/g.124351  ORF Transcript_44599/g.124351 Transcript_44599/m.124351 type:complete len:327 (-) Transcript_44599:829-1809(-)
MASSLTAAWGALRDPLRTGVGPVVLQVDAVAPAHAAQEGERAGQRLRESAAREVPLPRLLRHAAPVQARHGPLQGLWVLVEVLRLLEPLLLHHQYAGVFRAEPGVEVGRVRAGPERHAADHRERADLRPEPFAPRQRGQAALQHQEAAVALLSAVVQPVLWLRHLYLHRRLPDPVLHARGEHQPLAGPHAELQATAGAEDTPAQVALDGMHLLLGEGVEPLPPTGVEEAEGDRCLLVSPLDSDVVVDVHENVVLVDDLILDDLLHDILQRNYANDVVGGIHIRFYARSAYDPEVSATSLELLENLWKLVGREKRIRLAPENINEIT